MKTNLKTTRRVNKRPALKRKGVVLIGSSRLGVRHFRLIERKHTFKLLHHRHTSHLALFMVLVFVGFFMYASSQMAQAVTYSGNVSVGVIVPGPPPEIGATIINPRDGDKFKNQNIIDVNGTCYSNSFVVIKNNNIQVGSTNCSNDGVFSLQVQITQGKNILSALNYDNLNQAGPPTPSVTIYATRTVDNKPITSTTTDNNKEIATETPMLSSPEIPDNPSIITGVNSTFLSCNDYKPDKLVAGGELHVAIVCVPRLFMPQTEQVMGILVWGGTPPYALSVNFGTENDEDNETTLVSMSAPGYRTIKFSYAMPDTYRIKFRLTDKNDNTAVVETAVQVSGEKKTSATSVVNDIINTIFSQGSLLESTVPFYLLAVAVTLGFWGGDIFDRKFGSGKRKIGRKATA